MIARAAGTSLDSYRYFEDFVEGRRGEILDAALAVFGEKGYEAGTMREIAARVGVSEPAIYRHYESKEAILADIVATAGDRIAGEVREWLAQVNGANIVKTLYALIEFRRAGSLKRKRAEIGGGAGDVMHILFHAAPHNEMFINLMRAHIGQPLVDEVRNLVPRVDAEYGIERSAEELESRVRVFMSLFAGYFTTSLVFDAPPNDTAIVDAILAIMGWQRAAEAS
jgi:AcrR family transcriptional regulator